MSDPITPQRVVTEPGRAALTRGVEGDAPPPPGCEAKLASPEWAQRPARELVEDIKSGKLRAAELDAQTRCLCVAHMTGEGYGNGQIAEALGISERTIQRDRELLRKAHARPPHPALGDEVLGELERLAAASVARLTRLARDAASPPYVRLWAEDAIIRNYQRFVETARRMEYLESGSRRIKRYIELDPHEQRQSLEQIAARVTMNGFDGKAHIANAAKRLFPKPSKRKRVPPAGEAVSGASQTPA